MMRFVQILIILLLGYSYGFPARPFYANESTLQLVHVIFRHGDRTPDQYNLYSKSPYYNESYYWPYGYGQLRNEGKRRQYHIGTALRRRYNRFLGNEWNIDLLDVRSTDFNRTKMSAQLMLAGLWPPVGINIWNPLLHWQSIPYKYEAVKDDKELLPFVSCTRFKRLLNKTMNSAEISSYLSLRYNQSLNILAEKTGMERTYLNAFYLYLGFSIQEELNLPLDKWTEEIYPEPLKSLAVDYYYLQTNNTELRKILAGYFLRKMITDTQRKIDGTIRPSNRKMFVYSAHERNIAYMLLALEAFKIVDIPPYGSYLLFEIHQIDNVFGLKLFYQDYSTGDHQLLQIPGCADFCPFNEFVGLIEEILPKSDEECYDNSRNINDL